MPFVITLIFIVITGIIVVFFISKSINNKNQQTNINDGNTLKREFFSNRYFFADDIYGGIVNFELNDNSNCGSYSEEVSNYRSKKAFNIKGKFCFSETGIVFTPSNKKNQIRWILKKINRENESYIFYDPNNQREDIENDISVEIFKK